MTTYAISIDEKGFRCYTDIRNTEGGHGDDSKFGILVYRNPDTPRYYYGRTSTGIPIDIECFQNAADFLAAYQNNVFDALLLDIDMPELTGFDLAQQLRTENDNIPIVYITGRDDLITQAFRYKPIGFVRKQHIDIELPFALTTILSELNRKKPTITVTETRSAGGATHTILIDNILYIESIGHNVKMHLSDGTSLTARGILSEYLEQSGFSGFIQINSGTIVNCAHISLNEDKVQCKNGTVLYISRRKQADVRKAYLKYVKKVLI